MKRNYLYILLLFLVFNLSAMAQSQQNDAQKDNQIEGLQIYPNPVTNKQVVVSTESKTAKQIELFDLLGKKVFTTQSESERTVLQLDDLKPGVYLIRITEKKQTVTRKLVLK